MFNLIVAGGGWSGNRDLFPRARVLEYTSDELKERFKPNSVLDTDNILKLPTLFMAETVSSGTQNAHVGTVTRIRQDGANYQLEYAYDAAIPSISNAMLADLAGQLDIGDWEFNRTHWAIKDVDLFQVLIRSGFKGPMPRVFQLSDQPIDNTLVSVMMPFNAGFDDVYAALEGAARRAGKHCQRADNIWNHDAIIQDVVSLICTSSVVVCDLTGKNANVFYETGIAHTLGKDVILITQVADDVPFDLRHLRFVQYLNNGEGRERLAEQVRNRINTLNEAR